MHQSYRTVAIRVHKTIPQQQQIIKNALNVFSPSWTILGPPGPASSSHLTALPIAFHSSVPGTQNCSPIHQCRLPVCGVTFLPLDPWLHPRVSNTSCGDTAWPHHEHASPLPPWKTWTSWPSRCPEGPPCNQIQGVPHGPEGWKAPCWEAPLQPHHLHAARKEYLRLPFPYFKAETGKCREKKKPRVC